MIGCRFTNEIMHPLSWSHRSFVWRDVPTKRQVVGRVASPDLGGGQVAVLRLHAVSAGRVTKAAYSCLSGMYVRHGTKYERAPRKFRTSENSVKAKFAELPFHALE